MGTDVTELTVVFDPTCTLCQRCKTWLIGRPQRIPLRFLAANSPTAQLLYGDQPWLGIKLAVIAQDGRAWIDGPAFVMCLWATRRYHRLAAHMGDGAFEVVARRFFTTVSNNRARISAVLSPPTEAAVLADCETGTCHR